MWLERLVELKRLSGKTIKQIATESNVPLGTLNKLFSGQTKDPKLDTVRAVVHSLGYTLDDLYPVSKKGLSETAFLVAKAYDKADQGTQGAVRKLLDVDVVPLEYAPIKEAK